MSEMHEVVVDGRKAWVCDIDVGRPGIELVFQDNGQEVIAFKEPEEKSMDDADKFPRATDEIEGS